MDRSLARERGAVPAAHARSAILGAIEAMDHLLARCFCNRTQANVKRLSSWYFVK